MHFRSLLSAALIAMTFSSADAGEILKTGDAAPQVKVKNDEGKNVDLGAELKSGIVLVYFYPKADTPGCTKEACAIKDSWTTVQAKGVKVFGVSMDTVEAQKAFKEKFSLPFPLLADVDGKVVEAFGVKMKAAKIPSRQSFLLKDGKVVWVNPDVKADTHIQEVLAEVDKLGASAEKKNK